MTTSTPSPAPTTSLRSESRFLDLLRQQVRRELTASQQYLAIAVWHDGHDLPELAGRFYRQAAEERDHALMMVRYLLDRDADVAVPGVDDVRNDFGAPRDTIALALEQERAVTAQVEELFQAARAEGDGSGEQFMLWFLKEQVEEVASMSALLTLAQRVGDDWLRMEEFLARQPAEAGGPEADAPPVAGAGA